MTTFVSRTSTRTATLSEDGVYRYVLGRRWGKVAGRFATFVMLNPSTADAYVDDRTIGRCRGFAQSWGMDGLIVVNLYALRSTDPKGLWAVEDPVGPDNDYYLQKYIQEARDRGLPLVAAWGANAKLRRVVEVMGMPGAASFQCLGHTKDLSPKHPLYLPGDTILEPYL